MDNSVKVYALDNFSFFDQDIEEHMNLFGIKATISSLLSKRRYTRNNNMKIGLII